MVLLSGCRLIMLRICFDEARCMKKPPPYISNWNGQVASPKTQMPIWKRPEHIGILLVSLALSVFLTAMMNTRCRSCVLRCSQGDMIRSLMIYTPLDQGSVWLQLTRYWCSSGACITYCGNRASFAWSEFLLQMKEVAKELRIKDVLENSINCSKAQARWVLEAPRHSCCANPSSEFMSAISSSLHT